MTQGAEYQPAPHEIVSISAPSDPIYRIARLGVDPFDPPPWEFVGGNRFDDPRREFRAIYCASARAAAFGETLVGFRPSPRLVALMHEVNDSETLDEALSGLLDPGDPHRGVVPFDWRFKRQVGSTILDPSLKFAAIAEPESIAHLRVALAPVVTMMRLSKHEGDDFDLSTIFSGKREITQHCARYIYELCGAQGKQRFAGICYPSRVNLHWTCWAIFDDRLIHTPLPPETTIDLRDPGLSEAAQLLDLSVEVIRGHGTYWHP
jgi:hypothetical protein